MRKSLFAFLLFAIALPIWASSLLKCQVVKEANGVQLLLTFDKNFKYHSFTLSRPQRFVTDIKQARLKTSLWRCALRKNDLFQLRYSVNKRQKNIRLVLDLKKAKSTPVVQKRKNQLAIILHNTSVAANNVKTKTANDLSNKLAVKKWRDVVVVIDPGHGGRDPGAIGKRRTKEKHVVLAISKELKQYIDKEPGMVAKLTRSGDNYVSLRQRLALARNYKADIFISVHADAYRNRHSRGVSVYALSQRGATSEAARWIAEKENHSELGNVDLSELDDKSGLVRSVLIDLSQTATIGLSLKLGSAVLNNLGKIATRHNKTMEQARFVVLKSPDIPSILIETGFISNPKEERNLRSSWYRRHLVLAIVQGIKRYFSINPPRHTYLVQMKKPYQVVRGDSLGKIARRFDVSVKALMKYNRLSTKTIRVGQTLYIPHHA